MTAWRLTMMVAGAVLGVGCAGGVDTQNQDGGASDGGDASVVDSATDVALTAEGGPVEWCPTTAPKDGSPCDHPGLKCVRRCGEIGDYTAVCGRITDTFGYWGVTYPCGRDGGR